MNNCHDCQDRSPCTSGNCTCPVKDLSTDCILYTGENLTCSGIPSKTILTDLIEQFDAFVCQLVATTLARTLVNIGTGAQIYKGEDNLGNKEIRSILTTPSITVTQNANDITPAINEDWLDDHIDEYLETNPPCIISPDGSLTIDVVDGCTTIQITSVDEDIPRFIVNSAYTGDNELGTLSQPFKDIPQAITAFLLLAQPATIQIQKGFGYNFTGNIAYNNLTVELETGAVINSNPTNGWFCDTTVVADNLKLEFTLILNKNSRIQLAKNGFRNNGTNVNNVAFTTYKRINISGEGDIIQTVINSANPNEFVIFDCNFGNIANMYNDNASILEVFNINVRSQTQPIRKAGGLSRIIFDNVNYTIANPGVTPNAAMITFQQTGGDISETSCVFDVLADNLNLYSFSKDASFICSLKQANCSIVSGNTNTVYTNTTALKSALQVINSGTEKGLNVQDIFKSPSVVWDTVLYHNNYISDSANGINTQVDLTMNNTTSVSNKIGGNIIESLVSYVDRATAEAALPKGAKFINRNSSGTPANWTTDITMT